MLQWEQDEQSELQKTKNQLVKVEKELEEKTTDVERLTQMTETLGKIKIQSSSQPQQMEVAWDNPAIIELKKRAETAEAILTQIRFLATAGKIDTVPPDDSFLSATSQDLYKTWEPKMPSLCAKRIFKYLITNKDAKYTKAQLGVQLGYKTSAGTFTGAIAFLKQNKLVNYDGKFLWVEWK
jgi:hypothetical protein